MTRSAQKGERYALTLLAARERLLTAGFSTDMAEAVCEQAAIDYPGWGEDWARAVEGDVEALCTDPTSFDDGGAK